MEPVTRLPLRPSGQTPQLTRPGHPAWRGTAAAAHTGRPQPATSSAVPRTVVCVVVVLCIWLAAVRSESETDAATPTPPASKPRRRLAPPTPHPPPPTTPHPPPPTTPHPPPPATPSPTAVSPAPATDSPTARAAARGAPAGCELVSGVWFSGPPHEGPLRDKEVAGAEECAALCTEVSLCGYFNFRESDSRCHLFTARGRRTEEAGYVTGDCFDAKRDEPAAEAEQWGGAADVSDPMARVHLSVSVACSAFYLWQAQTLLWTARQVGHPAITVIVVGCDTHRHAEKLEVSPTHQREQDQRVPPRKWKALVGPRGWRLHFVPSTPEAAAFPWFNKPWSFVHWRANAAAVNEPVVAVLDPDEFFLTPLIEPGLGSEYITSLKGLNGTVVPGRAVAQRYGIGSGWLKFAPKTCPQGSHCLALDHRMADQMYSVGPPMMLHAQDTEKVFAQWLSFMKPVLQQDGGKDILADMWAYSMSAAHHRVDHDRYEHMMVSNTQAGGEGWQWVEQLDGFPCRDPLPWLRSRPHGRIPTLVHCASHAKAGVPPFTTSDHRKFHDIHSHPRGGEVWNFHKGHVPPDFLSCDEPLLVQPPDDLFEMQTTKRGKREAFYVCVNVAAVNEAAAAYKRRNCRSPNLSHCTRMSITHEQARERAPKGGPAYPLAYRTC